MLEEEVDHRSLSKERNRSLRKASRLWVLLTGSAVITHDVTTGTGYFLVGFDWIIDVLN